MTFVTEIMSRKWGRPPIGRVAMTAAERQRRHRAKQRRSVHFSSRTAEWETPQPFFDKLHSEFHFTLDVCATAENTKCARPYQERQRPRAVDRRLLAQPTLWPANCPMAR
jgi:DNA N-6-adenine-methyltransferase (Dam)